MKLKGLVLSVALAFSLEASQIYATVNGENVTNKDIVMVLGGSNMDFNSLNEKQKKDVLNQAVDNKLLASYAIKNGIEKNDEYKEKLAQIKKDLALQTWIAKELNSISVTQKELKDEYKKREKNTEYKARHILVDNEQEASKIIEKLKKSKNLVQDFISTAKENSKGPSGSNGGDLGWFVKERMVPEFGQALSKMKKGAISSKPVKTEFGYHIILLEDTKAVQLPPFEQTKEQLEKVMKIQKFQNKIKSITDTLRQKAKIVIK
jgi:parvulin-like peptidyl-prolyl isomerase